MQQLMFEEAGAYIWRDAPEPQITAPGQPFQDAPSVWPTMTGKTVFTRAA